jgi:hypothetical protein
MRIGGIEGAIIDCEAALGFMNNPNSRHPDLECHFEMINEPIEPMTCVNILDAHHYAESLSRPSNQSE